MGGIDVALTYEPSESLAAMAPAPYGALQLAGAAPSIGADPRPVQDAMLRALDGTDDAAIEGVEEEIDLGPGARSKARTISWTCWTNRGNQLLYNGAPFKARYLAWSVSGVSWQAGVGWPVFTSYCPVSDYDYRFKFPDAYRFQIVPVFGHHYWLGCGPSASGTGSAATEVWVWVNDFPDAYDDNAGTFKFQVTGWSA